MARLEHALYSRLTNVASATYALVGTRVYPVQADQAATLPFVVFSRESEERGNAFGSTFVPALSEAEITFEIHAKSPEKADLIADAIYTDMMAQEAAFSGVTVKGILFGRTRHGVAWLPDAYMVEADYRVFWAA